MADNPPIQIYVNGIKNRIVFKRKTGCKLKLLSPETMKLLGSAKQDIDKDKDKECMPEIESVVSVHYNLVNNSYQQAPNVKILQTANCMINYLFRIFNYS